MIGRYWTVTSDDRRDSDSPDLPTGTVDDWPDWNEDAAVIVSGLVIRQPCVVAVLAGRGRHRAGRQQPGSVVPGRLPATRRDAPVKSERQMCVRARPTRRKGKKKKTRHMNQSVILIVFAMFLSPSSGQLAGANRRRPATLRPLSHRPCRDRWWRRNRFWWTLDWELGTQRMWGIRLTVRA